MTDSDKGNAKGSGNLVTLILALFCLISLIAAVYFFIQSRKEPIIITKEGKVIKKEPAQFELLVPELVSDKQTLELHLWASFPLAE